MAVAVLGKFQPLFIGSFTVAIIILHSAASGHF